MARGCSFNHQTDAALKSSCSLWLRQRLRPVVRRFATAIYYPNVYLSLKSLSDPSVLLNHRQPTVDLCLGIGFICAQHDVFDNICKLRANHP
jgi:hypothetical protein